MVESGGRSGSIALALSGGGSRAMAFHLGCMRALHQAELLGQVDTISSVSGGSVLAALYCSHPGDFDAFERRARQLLSMGFFRPALWEAISSLEGLKALGNALLLSCDRVLALAVRLALLVPFIPRPNWSWLVESPIPRRFSRTTILRRVFDNALGGASLEQLREDRPKLIMVACDLIGRSAFYFAKDGVGSWRRGRSTAERIPLAHAVAASAAFPGLLPALDAKMEFAREGQTTTSRVILTDGGVYDNLGLAPLWPDREVGISLHSAKYDFLIACRAGYGSKLSPASAFWPSRMLATLDVIHARAQNSTMKRLFDLNAAGHLKAFILPFLDQADDKLEGAPSDLVRAAEAANYPTNFFGMKQTSLNLLVKRGEQLTQTLLQQYREQWQSATG